jgi:hypothetical protein
MKKQTFITYWLDDETRAWLDFERWGYKRQSSVIRALKYLYNDELYRHLLHRPSTTAVIYTTDDDCKDTFAAIVKLPEGKILTTTPPAGWETTPPERYQFKY